MVTQAEQLEEEMIKRKKRKSQNQRNQVPKVCDYSLIKDECENAYYDCNVLLIMIINSWRKLIWRR